MAGVDQESELQVVAWRRTMLEQAGYDREYADILAASLDVDLHEAVGLLEQGCRPSVAVLILL